VQPTVLGAVDLLPTLCAIAGARLPSDVAFDGENLQDALLGKQAEKRKPLFWEYGRNQDTFKYPGPPRDRSPNVALRSSSWKLLIHADGTGVELYDLTTDARETTNVEDRHPDVARRLSEQALAWRRSLPALESK
jgi:arylsulfatase A-like enzyme